MLHLWDAGSIEGFDWGMPLDLFQIRNRSDYLRLNVSLWFILCIFWVQIFYYCISRLPLWANALTLLAIWLLWDFFAQIPAPFMINRAICWTLYFGLGNLTGQYIIKLVENPRNSAMIFIAGSVIMLLIDLLLDRSGLSKNIFFICWCIVAVAGASFLKKLPGLDWLGFFGANTLLILCTHIWVLTPFERLMFKLTRTTSPLYAAIITLFTAIFVIPIILIVNRYFPFAAGKHEKTTQK